ncbi:winged helix DNA-binding domain-containing protein [Nocardioides sp. YIM 152588]|uniref:winged helix DNA-binding domain-containing protein n=1 Tax=Nocardioides sp. YIM 152588 TaxID=3158259 RepID=UPI0032E3C65E
MRHIDDAERRARLGRRHGLARPFPDVLAAARGLTALHATEAATVHLALWARVPGVSVADVEAALYDDRTLVKQLAMRRTLFAFPVEALPAVWGSAAARVAQQQRAQLTKDLARAGLADDPAAWLDTTGEAVLEAMADGRPRTAAELREEVPALAGRITRGTPGRKWAAELPIGPNVLTALGAAGRIVRGVNAGHWRLNKPSWQRTEDWLGAPPAPAGQAEGYATLVRGWLRAFGPGTEDDLVWWLGATKTIVRAALADVGAVAVDLGGDATGWVLPDDLEPVASPPPWVALLPTLDPTVMGWKGRDFYLDPSDRPYLFDPNGNAGNTAWSDGRIVGAWAQDDDGRVRLLLRRDPGAEARRALEAQAGRLTAWLDGVRIVNVYASPQMKGLTLR